MDKPEAIRIYGDPILRHGAADVPRFDEALRSLAARLLRAQEKAEAVGMAAVQIGVPKNVFSIDAGRVRRGGRAEVLVNPILVDQDGEIVEEEGCLSFPGVFIRVARPRWVALQACDLDGKIITREAEGLLARGYVHEIDHLQGRLFIDRVDPDTRDRVLERMRSLKVRTTKG